MDVIRLIWQKSIFSCSFYVQIEKWPEISDLKEDNKCLGTKPTFCMFFIICRMPFLGIFATFLKLNFLLLKSCQPVSSYTASCCNISFQKQSLYLFSFNIQSNGVSPPSLSSGNLPFLMLKNISFLDHLSSQFYFDYIESSLTALHRGLICRCFSNSEQSLGESLNSQCPTGEMLSALGRTSKGSGEKMGGKEREILVLALGQIL